MLAGERKVSHSRALAIGTAQAVLWTVLCLALTVGAFSVVKVFRRASVPLPDITTTVVDFAVFLRDYRQSALVAACVWPFVNWGMVRLLSGNPESFILRRLWYLTTWIVPIVAALFALTALMVPLMALQRQLS